MELNKCVVIDGYTYDTVFKILLTAILTKGRPLHEGILGSDLDAATVLQLVRLV
jgi:hypothetical protein